MTASEHQEGPSLFQSDPFVTLKLTGMGPSKMFLTAGSSSSQHQHQTINHLRIPRRPNHNKSWVCTQSPVTKLPTSGRFSCEKVGLWGGLIRTNPMLPSHMHIASTQYIHLSIGYPMVPQMLTQKQIDAR